MNRSACKKAKKSHKTEKNIQKRGAKACYLFHFILKWNMAKNQIVLFSTPENRENEAGEGFFAVLGKYKHDKKSIWRK